MTPCASLAALTYVSALFENTAIGSQALGREGTASEMMNLVKALGMEADEARANDVLFFLKAEKK